MKSFWGALIFLAFLGCSKSKDLIITVNSTDTNAVFSSAIISLVNPVELSSVSEIHYSDGLEYISPVITWTTNDTWIKKEHRHLHSSELDVQDQFGNWYLMGNYSNSFTHTQFHCPIFRINESSDGVDILGSVVHKFPTITNAVEILHMYDTRKEVMFYEQLSNKWHITQWITVLKGTIKTNNINL